MRADQIVKGDHIGERVVRAVQTNGDAIQMLFEDIARVYYVPEDFELDVVRPPKLIAVTAELAEDFVTEWAAQADFDRSGPNREAFRAIAVGCRKALADREANQT